MSDAEHDSLSSRKVHHIEFRPGTPESDATIFFTNETGFISVNYDESKAGVLNRDYILPDPLTFADGRKVASAADWALRRKEMLAIFEREVYGRMPMKSLPLWTSCPWTGNRFRAEQICQIPQRHCRFPLTARAGLL